jgi:hypothetical protein
MNDTRFWYHWCNRDNIPSIFLEEMNHGKEAYQGYRLDSNWTKGKYKEYTPTFEKEKIASIVWKGNNGVLITWDKKITPFGGNYTVWKLNKEINSLDTNRMIHHDDSRFKLPRLGVENNTFYTLPKKLEYDKTSKQHFHCVTLSSLDSTHPIPNATVLHQKSISHVAIEQKKLATRDETGIYLWSRINYELIHYIPNTLGEYDKSIYLKHNFLIFRQDKEKLCISDLTTFKLKYFIAEKILGISKKLIITKQENSIQFLSLETGEVVGKFDFDQAYLCYNCNYEKFGLGFQDGRVMIWDLSSINVVLDKQINKEAILCLQFLPNWKFATGSEKGQVIVWDIHGALLYSPQKTRWRGAVQRLVSNNDRLFALFKDKTLKIWVFDNSQTSHYAPTYTALRHIPVPSEEEYSQIS